MSRIPAAAQAIPSCSSTFINEQAARHVRYASLRALNASRSKPGRKKTLHFTLGKDELQFWSPAEKKWVVEPEHFDVWVGGDSTAQLHDEFQLTK